ncbi:MAG: type IV pilus secretin PilQ [Thermodesulfobacteriota bacterium]
MITKSAKKWKLRAVVCFLGIFLAALGMYGCATTETVPSSTETGEAATGREAPAGGNLITGISIEETADAIVISIQANHPIDYTLAEPPLQQAKVLYFPDSGLSLSSSEYPVDNEVIGSVQAIELVKGGPSKIVVPIKNPGAACEARRGDDETSLQLVFPRVAEGQAAAAKNTAQDTVTEEESPPVLDEEAAPSVEEATPVPTGAAATRLEKVDVTEEAGQVTVRMKADGTIKNYKRFTLTGPPRIVVDLVGLTSSAKKEQRLLVKSDIVQQVRYLGHEGYVRVVIDAKPAYLKDYKVVPVADGLMVYVGNSAKVAQAPVEQDRPAQVKTEETAAVAPSSGSAEEAASPAITEEETPAPVAAEEESAPPVAAKAASVSSESYGRTALVNRIDFIDEQGKSTVSIGTTRPVEFELTRTGANKVRLTLQGADILSFRQRPLITTRFDSAINSIMPLQTPAMKAKGISVLDINLREEVGYKTEQQGNMILVHFDRSSVSADPAQKVVIPTGETVIAEEPKSTPAADTETGADRKEMTASESAAAEEPEIAAEPEVVVEEESTVAAEEAPATMPGRKKVYTGEPIALEFYKTDIRNVIRILKDVSGKNFAIDEGVMGSVTLSFVNPVPWDQVLDLILEMNNLGMMEHDGIVRISTKETILKQKEAERAAMAAEQELKTTQEQLAPLVTEYFPISYANASQDILPHITDILTPEKGHAKVDERTNQLIMTDIQEKLDMARQIIKEIDKVTPQVMINARIVETSTTFSREFGVEWGMENTPGTYESDLGGIYNYGVSMNNPAAAASNILGFNFTRITGTPFSLGAWLSLMETVGQVKIISSPRVVTLNKKKATISQGQEIPYTTVDEGEADTEFKDADLKLEVTPQVTPDNRISMNIHIEEKEVGEQGSFDEPPLNTKEATTELLVNDGDTIVIGGIIQSTEKEGESGVPYLSKIPLLGFLFKHQSRSSENSELLIFITPTIIRLE